MTGQCGMMTSPCATSRFVYMLAFPNQVERMHGFPELQSFNDDGNRSASGVYFGNRSDDGLDHIRVGMDQSNMTQYRVAFSTSTVPSEHLCRPPPPFFLLRFRTTRS